MADVRHVEHGRSGAGWCRALWKLFLAQALEDGEAEALITLLFVVGVGVQGLACWNAEFNLEQGEAGNIWEPLHYVLYGTGVQNFEWAVEYAIRTPLFVFPLALLAFPAWILPLSKLQVLFVIRFSHGVISCGALQYMARALRPSLGNETSVLGLLLCLLNHGLALALGRLGVDSQTIVLHSLCIAMWQEHRQLALIWLCAVASFNRANYVVLAVCMGVHVLLFQRPKADTGESSTGGRASGGQSMMCADCKEFHAVRGQWGGQHCSVCGKKAWEKKYPVFELFEPLWGRRGWFAFLLFHALVAIAVVAGLMLLTDTLWYGRLTLSWFNFVSFNMMQQGADNFGRMPAWFYVDKLLLDNNLVLSVFGVAGVLLSRRAALLAAPSLALLAVLFCIPHKEYRFLWPLLPVLAFCAGSALNRLRTSGAVGWWATTAVLALHVFSGLSILLLQLAVYTPHAAFAHEAAAFVRSSAAERSSACAREGHGRGLAGGGAGAGACLCSFPWCSWLLPPECSKVYTTCVYEEFFPGYANVTYRRFEARAESALLDIAPEDGSYTYRQWHEGVKDYDAYIAHESRRLRRLEQGGQSLGGGWGRILLGDALAPSHARTKAALEEVEHVFFFEISSSPFPRFSKAYAMVTGMEEPSRAVAPKVIHHLYSELMLRPYMVAANFVQQAAAVGVSEPGVFNFDPHERLFALWMSPRLWQGLRVYTIHSYWARHASEGWGRVRSCPAPREGA